MRARSSIEDERREFSLSLSTQDFKELEMISKYFGWVRKDLCIQVFTTSKRG